MNIVNEDGMDDYHQYKSSELNTSTKNIHEKNKNYHSN